MGTIRIVCMWITWITTSRRSWSSARRKIGKRVSGNSGQQWERQGLVNNAEIYCPGIDRSPCSCMSNLSGLKQLVRLHPVGIDGIHSWRGYRLCQDGTGRSRGQQGRRGNSFRRSQQVTLLRVKPLCRRPVAIGWAQYNIQVILMMQLITMIE